MCLYVWHGTGICVYVWGCTCEARGECKVSCSTILCLIPFREGFSLNLEVNWDSENPGDPLVATIHSSGLIGMYMTIFSFLIRVLGIQTQAFMLAQQVLLPTETSL